MAKAAADCLRRKSEVGLRRQRPIHPMRRDATQVVSDSRSAVFFWRLRRLFFKAAAGMSGAPEALYKVMNRMLNGFEIGVEYLEVIAGTK